MCFSRLDVSMVVSVKSQRQCKRELSCVCVKPRCQYGGECQESETRIAGVDMCVSVKTRCQYGGECRRSGVSTHVVKVMSELVSLLSGRKQLSSRRNNENIAFGKVFLSHVCLFVCDFSLLPCA